MTQIVKKQINEIVSDIELKERIGEFQYKLNAKPPKDWIKKHPFIKEYHYLPIERVEFLIRTLFQQWEWKVNDYKVIANSITVHGTLKVLDPVTNNWLSYDGLGAVDIQLKSGSNATEMNNIVSGAIMKGLPSAESYALKDAAEKLGTIFGGDLNRKDEIVFKSVYSKWTTEE